MGGSRGLLVEPRGLVVDAGWLCLDLQSPRVQEARFGRLHGPRDCIVAEFLTSLWLGS